MDYLVNATDAKINHHCQVRGIVVYFEQSCFCFRRADLDGKVS